MTASQEPRPPQRAAVFNSGPVVQAGEKFEMRGRYVAGRDMTVIHEARPAPQALFQLPPDIREFTDRETELTELGRLIEPAGEAGTAVVVSALMGKPGVGKSALVIHLAHRLAPRFPDAQLYVDLRGPEQERREPAEVLAEFLRALGVDGEAVPATLAERAGLYRGLLAGRRALVVLDNARDERQLRPLLPGSPGCAVLITSRAPLGGLEGARLQPLDVIDRPAAVELLGKIAGPERVGAEPQAAAAIADLCGDLPLAVRIAGGLLAERSSWNVARLAARLGDERRRLSELQVGDREVRGSFALGYHELSADEARLFRRLGALSGPDFGTRVAAALDDTSPEMVERVLERLVDAQLLETPTKNRYRFHDLLKLFARECLNREEPFEARQAAAGRARRWYLEAAVTADTLLGLPSEEHRKVDDVDPDAARAEALRWFQAERANLVATVGEAHRVRDWETAQRLAWSLTDFFALRAHWDDWQHTHELAFEAARRAGDRYGEARSLNGLGAVHDNQGRWEEAIDCHEQSLAICRDLGDRLGEARSLNGLGSVYDDQGRWDEAIGCHEQSLAIFRELGHRHGEGRSRNNLGLVFVEQGRWDEAIDCYEQSLAIFRELGDRHDEARSRNNLGNVFARQGLWEEAIDCYEQSLTTFRELGDRGDEGRSLGGLGSVFADRGRWEEAIDCYEQSLAIFRELGDRLGEAQTLGNLGVVFTRQGRWEEAIDCYEQSLAIFRELGDRLGEARSRNDLGLVFAGQGRWEEAISCHKQSLAIFRELGDRRDEGRSLNGLGSVFADRGRWEEAIDCYEQDLAICRELGDRLGEAQTLGNLGSVFAGHGRWEEAVGCYEQSLAIFRELGDRVGEAQTLESLGSIFVDRGRWEEAIGCYEQSLAICRELGDRLGEAQTLGNLGLALRAVDKPNESAAQLKQALAILEEVKAPEAEQVRGLMAERPRRSWLQRFRRSG